MTITKKRELTAVFMAMVAARSSNRSLEQYLRVLPINPEFKRMGLQLAAEAGLAGGGSSDVLDS